MKIRKHIPNLLTCTNLAFGFYACIVALSGNYFGAMIAIMIAAGFDFADGLAARLLNAYSPIGKDLDSLADIVGFGVAPGMILFHFLDCTQKTVDWSHPLTGKVFLFAALAVPVFSALRLAKFNNDDRQTSSFIGLPVPAHALFWASLIYGISLLVEGNAIAGFFPQLISIRLPYIPSFYMLLFISITAIVSSLLLVSEMSMFSLKIKSLKWKGNELCYVLFIAAVVSIACFGFAGIALTVLLYIFLSMTNRKTTLCWLILVPAMFMGIAGCNNRIDDVEAEIEIESMSSKYESVKINDVPYVHGTSSPISLLTDEFFQLEVVIKNTGKTTWGNARDIDDAHGASLLSRGNPSTAIENANNRGTFTTLKPSAKRQGAKPQKWDFFPQVTTLQIIRPPTQIPKCRTLKTLIFR